MITWEIIREWSALDGLSNEWDGLLLASATNVPTLSYLWLRAWWQVFGSHGGRKLAVCAVRADGDLIGLAPFLSRRVVHRTGMRLRRIELLASGEPLADEIVSDYIGVLARVGWEQAVARAVIDWLVCERDQEWDELVCPRMDARAPMTRALVEHLQERAVPWTIERRDECCYIELPSTWDAYLNQLPSRHRYTVRRSLRELERWRPGRWRVRIARSVAELEEGIDILRTLHSQRWQASGRSGVFASQRFVDFHAQVMPQLLAKDALQLIWLMADDEPIAALYNIVWDGVVHFYQSGRKVDVPEQVKPGITLHALAIRHSIDAGLREYDFLAGASRYKRQLGTHVRELIDVRAAPSMSWRESILQLGERGLNVVRRLRQRFSVAGERARSKRRVGNSGDRNGRR